MEQSDTSTAPQKKKRGRIPNKVKEQLLKEKGNTDENGELTAESSERQRILSKRGRKPKEINFKPQIAKIAEFEMEETVILHLPVSIDRLSEINSSFQGYKKILQDPGNPLPYLDSFHNSDSFSVIHNEKGEPQYSSLNSYNGQNDKKIHVRHGIKD